MTPASKVGISRFHPRFWAEIECFGLLFRLLAVASYMTPASKVLQAAAWDRENSVNGWKGIDKMLPGPLWGIGSAILIRKWRC
jgi:hypothetical protein